MKKNFLFFLTLSLLIGFTACQKEKGGNNNNNDEMSKHSDDQEQVAAEVDAVAGDADIALEATAGFAGRLTGTMGDICNATAVIDTASNPRTITITYNGLSCFGDRTRTGVIVISMPANTRWKNAGATITISFQNLKITRVRDNKSITINGSQTYTNVSGGLLFNLPNLNSITHTITSPGLSIKFDNNTTRTWQVAKQRVYTYDGGVVVTTTGTHTEGNVTGIAEWGTNRFGGTFFTSILEPLVIKQSCSFRLTSGKVKHTVGASSATATFGLNANGEPTSCPGNAAYYFKVVWTGPNGNSVTVILPY